jgi:hypothetical protein
MTMTLTLIAAGCVLLGVWLLKVSTDFRIDAAPVGSVMIATAVVLWIAGIFIFGIEVGRMTVFLIA